MNMDEQKYNFRKEQYQQLHKAIVLQSNKSLEIKKMFVISLGGSLAFSIPLLLNFFSIGRIEENLVQLQKMGNMIIFIIIVILTLFYLLDFSTYISQRSLRKKLDEKAEDVTKNWDSNGEKRTDELTKDSYENEKNDDKTKKENIEKYFLAHIIYIGTFLLCMMVELILQVTSLSFGILNFSDLIFNLEIIKFEIIIFLLVLLISFYYIKK